MAPPDPRLPGPVLFVSYSYPPDLGGTERQAELLALRLSDRGCSVQVIARSGSVPAGRAERSGIPVRRVPCARLPGLEWPTFALSAAAAGLAGERPAVVQSFILSAPAWAGAVIARLRGVAGVCRPSAGGPDGNLDRLRRSFYGRLAGRFILRRTDAFVCINDEVAAELEAAGVPSERLRLIPTGVDTSRFAPAPAQERRALRRRLGFERSVVALFVGRFETVKGLDTLLEVWERLAAPPRERLLALVGDGSLRARVEAATARLPSLRLFPPTAGVEEFYRAADLFVLPSRREGVSNSLLEAMSSGLPPVTSAVAGNAAVIRHGVTGLVAAGPEELGRGLERLLREPAERRRLGEEARRSILTRFGIETVAEAHLDLYRTLAGRNYQRHVPVLAYHRVVERPKYEMDVAAGQFATQMGWLVRHGYRALLPSDLARCLERNEPFPEDGVILTFDDGHRDNLQVALPILEHHGFRACVFLVAEFLGTTRWSVETRPGERAWHSQPPADWKALAAPAEAPSETHRRYEFLSCDECARLRDAGWELGAHTLSHPLLTGVPGEEARRQIADGRRRIEERLGVPVTSFCYPYGDRSLRVRGMVAEAGFRLAFVTPSHALLGAPNSDPLQFQRIGVFGSVDLPKFAMLVRGRYQAWRRWLPAWAWQMATRARRGLLPAAGRKHGAHA